MVVRSCVYGVRSMRAYFLLLTVLGAAGCTWARPVTYEIPPGVSASFTPSQLTASEIYAKTFCSVLELEFGSEGWETCDKYVRMTRPHPVRPLHRLRKDWALLRLGGFGAQCVAEKAEAFEDAAKHLEMAHGITSYHVPLGAFDTSEQNAVRIRDFVKHHPSTRFIVIAHSKGAADVMVALATYPRELRQIEAVITVAGAVGGSWLVDRFQGLNERVLNRLSLPTCVPGQTSPSGQNAIDSMRRTNRQAFLARHERLPIPAFSISAVSTRKKTSKILLPLWDRVAPYALEQDSHIVERESIVPGGTFLGRALGDHWAVAMPFDPNMKVSERALKVIDKNKYPRPALIEAALRVAIDKLAHP
jgi:pimeloyl-ACP methyl ester carboxylesterase